VPQIGDRLSQAGVEPRAVEHRVGAARRGDGFLIGPAVARLDQPQIVESAIEHRPRRGADILAELRLDQNDRRPPGQLWLLMIGAGQRSPVHRCAMATLSRMRERGFPTLHSF
jgi:hypothetical protein